MHDSGLGNLFRLALGKLERCGIELSMKFQRWLTCFERDDAVHVHRETPNPSLWVVVEMDCDEAVEAFGRNFYVVEGITVKKA